MFNKDIIFHYTAKQITCPFNLEAPLVQITERFLVRYALGELLEKGGVASAKAAPLRDQPAVEERARAQFEALKEFAFKERLKAPLTVECERLDPPLRRANDFERVDETIREIELDRILSRENTHARRVVEQAPDFAQAPAKLPARVGGRVPEQLAELTP